LTGKEKIRQYQYLGQGFLNSYSQVFFSDHPVFALLILLMTFLVPLSGLAGLTGVLISLLLAKWLGFDKLLISKGIFSYNTLLVTLPLGLFFTPGWALLLIIILASLLTFFLTVVFRNGMLKSNLPFLSWPFVIGLWIVMLAVRRFSSIEVGDQSLFELNRLYDLGGISLVNGVEWLNNLILPRGVRTYLISMGAVFFQYNLIAGLVVAIGLIISSRIAFLLSLTGFFSAYMFYSIIGLDINTLDYSYIGFNYILTAIAVGGFFLIPSVYTFIWTIALVPVVTLLTVSMEELLAGAHLSVYALPFNLLVPAFLFVLYQRQNIPSGLHPVIVQHNTPEKNLYAWSNYHNRLSRKAGILFRLPFLGKWKVSQGHNGSLTHKSDWRFAWDFVKEGPDGRTFTGDGFSLSDYQCYGKPVYPAADGVVETIVDGIPDNQPGDANTTQNWGNTIIIRHAIALYTKYSHLKAGTIRVKPGDYVVTSMELAQTGSSGRSPEPHLHFQVQAEPNVNAATIDYPFGYYLLDRDGGLSLKTYARPGENDWVANLIPDKLLKKTLHFIPGQKIRVSWSSGQNQPEKQTEWEVHTDYYNNSYLWDRQSHSIAWFVNDGQLFYFTHYDGPRSNPLFTFFLACFRIPLVFDRRVSITDQLPLTIATGRLARWLQDWVAPFYIFLHADFSLNYLETDDPVDPAVYTLKSAVSRKVFKKSTGETGFDILMHRDGTIQVSTTAGSHLVLTTYYS
jgi:urea transporter/murein DD-endopeptidase MepM/ murein hydrolase activator NlpD